MQFKSGTQASHIGLGCGRLGSLMAQQTPQEMRTLLAGARELGVNVFDTANIYGQGRSERLLGEAFRGAHGVCIITKAGQVFPLAQRLLTPLRAPISAVLKRSRSVKQGVAAARAREFPRNYQPEYLSAALRQSLRRLRRDHVEVFLLHSPRLEHLADGAAIDGLLDLKREGLAERIGVSCDDLPVLEAVADDPRIDAIEAPFGVARREMEAGLGRAAQRGAFVIAREVLSASPPLERPSVATAVSFAATHAGVSVALIGTTKLAHLREAMDAL